MALVTVQRSPSVSSIGEDDVDGDEEEDVVEELVEIDMPKRAPKLGRMRSPSFEGYFASKSGAFALSDGHLARSESTKTCGELQFHLQRMVTLLRADDVLRMAVRVESQILRKKRYLALVTDSQDQFSVVLGIDWVEKPTIGLVLPIFSSSDVVLDGDGGFHITSVSSNAYMFKPVSAQMLWSAIHVTSKAIEVARKMNYFPGVQGHTLLDYYLSKVDSDAAGISEWNLQKDTEETSSLALILSEKEEEEESMIKKLIKQKLREVMMKVDLDDVTSKEIRTKVEDEINMDLSEYKGYVDTEMLKIVGQMDLASKILDYLYLGSEWNASNYDELVEIGIGYVLNVTREIDNFFQGSFTYYNVRVWDIEESELLHHWDHTYRFINQARESGSKVLVHCRMGISRSASTVIAYLMKAEGWSLTRAMEHVRSCRSIIQPNPGFQKQLIIYEGILNSSRNRYSALFRQRSKSDLHRVVSADRKRQLFKKTKSSREVEDEEDNKNNEPEDESFNPAEEASPRPKSWSGSPSLRQVVVDVELDGNNKKAKAADSDLIDEGTGVLEGRAVTEGPLDICNARSESPNSDERERSHRLLNRAKTLPMDITVPEPKDDEAGESVGELPDISRRVSRGHLKRQVTDADLDSLVSEDVKERSESMMMQAFKASEMKHQLIRNLEQVGRSTKHRMDEEFSVESIVKPSSLRKLSKTRRLSIERRKSMSEQQDRPETVHRHRSFTEISPRSSVSTEPGEACSLTEKAKTLPLAKAGNTSCSQQCEGGNGKGCEPVASQLCDPAESNCEKKADENVVRRTQSRYKAFLQRSRTNIKEDSRRRTLDDRQLRKGLGELFKSRDVQKQEVVTPKEEELVIKDSQFTTVEQSKKQIEERVRQFNSRSLRSPRRRTVGESELRFERKKENRNDAPSAQKQGPQGDLEGPKKQRLEHLTEGCNKFSEIGSEVLCKSDAGLASGTDGERDKKGSQGCLDLSGLADDDVSVRELVKFHSEAIRQNSTSPSSGGSPTEASSPTAFSPTSMDPPDLKERQDASDAFTRGEEAPPASDVPFANDSLHDLAQKGIVKKHTEVFARASLTSKPPKGARRINTLPRKSKPRIGVFQSFDYPSHKQLSRGKSFPSSKSEGEIDHEVETILGPEACRKGLVTATGQNPETLSPQESSLACHLHVPADQGCVHSAPPSPDRARRETMPSTLADRSSSFDDVQLESFQFNAQSSMPSV